MMGGLDLLLWVFVALAIFAAVAYLGQWVGAKYGVPQPFMLGFGILLLLVLIFFVVSLIHGGSLGSFHLSG